MFVWLNQLFLKQFHTLYSFIFEYLQPIFSCPLQFKQLVFNIMRSMFFEQQFQCFQQRLQILLGKLNLECLMSLKLYDNSSKYFLIIRICNFQFLIVFQKKQRPHIVMLHLWLLLWSDKLTYHPIYIQIFCKYHTVNQLSFIRH